MRSVFILLSSVMFKQICIITEKRAKEYEIPIRKCEPLKNHNAVGKKFHQEEARWTISERSPPPQILTTTLLQKGLLLIHLL